MRNNQVANQVEKRKLSIMLADYEKEHETFHCNGINSLVVTHPDSRSASDAPDGMCNLFTASRDRLIKIW